MFIKNIYTNLQQKTYKKKHKVSTECFIRAYSLVLFLSVLMCGGYGNNQSELLRVRNFRGLSAGTTDGSLDVIFSIWGVVCNSKGYMSRLC